MVTVVVSAESRQMDVFGWFCLLSLPLPSPQEEHAQPAGTRRTEDSWIRAIAGSCPNQAPPRCAKPHPPTVLEWEIKRLIAECRGCFMLLCSIILAMLTGTGTYLFLFQDNFACKWKLANNDNWVSPWTVPKIGKLTRKPETKTEEK